MKKEKNSSNKTPLSYFEISSENLIHNINFFKGLLNSGTKVVSVIKANAYGHGLKEIAKIAEKYIDYFQVDDIEELRELRKVSSKETFVFGYVQKNDLEELIHLNGILGIYSLEQIEFINSLAGYTQTKAKIHICIDSALGRDGLLLKDLHEIVPKLKNYKNIIIDGIYSHFANIEDTPDFSHAKKQISLYEEAKELFKRNGYLNILTHISSSAGILVYESKSHTNSLVRLGIGQYGIWPSQYLFAEFLNKGKKLKPVLRWISHIAQIKELPAGTTIGYGLTYTTSKITKIAIVPQGYSDGYDRTLSSIGEVLVKGEKCRVLGRVSMNMIVIDISNLPAAKVEDEVVLLGHQDNVRLSLESLAEKAQTINYELISRLNPLIPRRIV